jgi:hypothetical protein
LLGHSRPTLAPGDHSLPCRWSGPAGKASGCIVRARPRARHRTRQRLHAMRERSATGRHMAQPRERRRSCECCGSSALGGASRGP